MHYEHDVPVVERVFHARDLLRARTLAHRSAQTRIPVHRLAAGQAAIGQPV
jgi:hypothetical protein